MIKNLDITIIISSIFGIATFFWTAYQYFDTRRRDQDLKEFEIYHKLIRELVQPDCEEGLYEDRQTAIIYELKNFKRYYPFSYRTLLGLKEKWFNGGVKSPRIFEEIELTLNFLKKKINK